LGDDKSAREMFDKYAEVPEDGPWPFAKWRDIMMARKKPRKIMVCPNTFVEGN
jgi:dipeptidyl-peptidase-3